MTDCPCDTLPCGCERYCREHSPFIIMGAPPHKYVTKSCQACWEKYQRDKTAEMVITKRDSGLEER